jgi:hypothetical protein
MELSLKEKIRRAEKKILTHTIALRVLKETCVHEEFKVVNVYVPGDYYQRSGSWKEQVCDICGNVETIPGTIKEGKYE